MTETLPQSPLISGHALVDLLVIAPDTVLLDLEGDTDKALDGAFAVTIETHFASPGGGTKGARPLPDIQTLQEHVSSWSVSASTPVVVYDDSGGLKAARAWWVLRWAGLTNVRLLDGGIGAGIAAGIRTGAFAQPTGHGDIVLSAGHLPVLTADEAADHAAHAILLDARAAGAFAGDPHTRQGGHIPGARHAPASANLAADHSFLNEQTLRGRYHALGVDGTIPIGVSCGSGVSATHDILALELIGISAALFTGSWSAWTADSHRPVAYGD
ncbi:sulfurtransferase [Sphingomonas sp. AP4-R1]|uniref:sulfurtransferase n=1 Tax=Sphingomonas sp. AP4-R1 TaxID=2735134 RepID=UPI0014933D1F|nr:rhodanese-like domain-containing protein [Sphingomonas sp. AP4-R1]QJU57368.1 sulfurtransferase [Sphingomonas sp. AP4-R1]